MNKKRLENLLSSIFSIFIMIAVAGGVITFVLFLIAIIMGGKGGSQLAVDISKVYLPYFIRAASIAVISGLFVFYVSNSHELSLETEKEHEPSMQSVASSN